MELRLGGVVAGEKISFIVGTGATFSLLISYSGPTQDSELTIKEVSEETYMQVRKQQLELDMEQKTGSKLEKEYDVVTLLI